MTSVRVAIVAEVERLLAEIEEVECLERMPSGDPDSFPALAIYDAGQAVIEGEPATTRYELALTIEGYAEGEGGTDAHEKLSALYASVVRQLLPEPPIGGLAEAVEEGDLRVSVAELGDHRRLGFALDLKIQFVTSRTDPSRPG